MHVVVLVPGDYYVCSPKEYYQNVFVVARLASGFDGAVLARCRKREELYQQGAFKLVLTEVDLKIDVLGFNVNEHKVHNAN